jgi:xylulokinase
MKTLIGVDIGTQGVKVVLFSAGGRRLATDCRPSQLHRPAPGVVEEDPEFQAGNVCDGIRACIRRAGIGADTVAAVGMDGQMAGVIGVGADGMAVTPYDSWLDTRCAPYIKAMRKKAGDEIIGKTGGPPSFNHGPKKLWWMHERPGVYRRIRAFVQPGGYAAMRLCGLKGEQAFIDWTYLHFSGFADTRAGKWDTGLCRRFRFDAAKLPRIVPPWEVVGGVCPAMAARCGLEAGTPVVAGCGDTAASFLACGATREGICVDVAGTASVFAATTSRFRADTRFHTLGWGRSATEGLWHPYAYINGGGMNLEWFRKQIAGFGGGGSGMSLQALDRAAAAIEPVESAPVFVPHLGGRVSPSWPDLRGAWAGLDWSHGAADLYRAALEGVALEYALYKRALLALNPELRLREVRVTGGGERSAVWNRIKADVLGIRVVQVARSEGAPLGAALVAGLGAGLFRSLDEAAGRWIRTGHSTAPDRKKAGLYAKRVGRYERLLGRLNGL